MAQHPAVASAKISPKSVSEENRLSIWPPLITIYVPMSPKNTPNNLALVRDSDRSVCANKTTSRGLVLTKRETCIGVENSIPIVINTQKRDIPKKLRTKTFRNSSLDILRKDRLRRNGRRTSEANTARKKEISQTLRPSSAITVPVGALPQRTPTSNTPTIAVLFLKRVPYRNL